MSTTIWGTVVTELKLTDKTTYYCNKDSVFITAMNTRRPEIRELNIFDAVRGMCIRCVIRNEDLLPFLTRWGIDDRVRWWFEPNDQWSFQSEIDERNKDVPPKPRRVTYVYFVANTERTLVKIGRTRYVDSRFRSLQTASPTRLDLIGHVEADNDLESQLHQRFAEHRRNGEWFALTDEIKEEMTSLLGPINW